MKERSFFYYDKLDSTMLEYQRLQEIQNGLLCIRAGTQADGVGRADHVWLSPPGGLWITFDIKHAAVIPSFALYSGYCIHKALCSTFAPLIGHLEIKWTNDVIFDGKKLGGVLCRHHPGAYTIGLGINTNNVIDADLGKFGAISLKQILGFEVSNEQLTNTLISCLEEHIKLLSHQITYITYCNEHLFGKNCNALIDVGTEPFEAEILGIDLQGALILRKHRGEIVNIHTGSILSVQAFS